MIGLKAYYKFLRGFQEIPSEKSTYEKKKNHQYNNEQMCSSSI